MALAEIGAPIGLKGALRIHTLKSVTGLPIDDSLLFDADACWIRLTDHLHRVTWMHARITACSAQTRGVKLELDAIHDRNQAELLRGAQVGLSRAAFPEADADEAYWADLLGCEVVNREGHVFGPVLSLQTNGEHDWLVVRDGMIPFVAQYIDQAEPSAKRITVDWQPEWFA